MTRSDCIPDRRSIIIYVSQFLTFISPSFVPDVKSLDEDKIITTTNILIEEEKPTTFSSIKQNKHDSSTNQKNNYKGLIELVPELSSLEPLVSWLNEALLDPQLNTISINKANNGKKAQNSKVEDYKVIFLNLNNRILYIRLIVLF